MNTAGILDLIVNAMALSFILTIDEMVFERLSTRVTKHMMSNLEDLPLYDTSEEEYESEEQVLERYNRDEFGKNRWRTLLLVMPARLLQIVLLLLIFIYKYYHNHCQQSDDGGWVAKPLYTPEDIVYNPLAFLFGLQEMARTPVWKMP